MQRNRISRQFIFRINNDTYTVNQSEVPQSICVKVLLKRCNIFNMYAFIGSKLVLCRNFHIAQTYPSFPAVTVTSKQKVAQSRRYHYSDNQSSTDIINEPYYLKLLFDRLNLINSLLGSHEKSLVHSCFIRDQQFQRCHQNFVKHNFEEEEKIVLLFVFLFFSFTLTICFLFSSSEA